MRIIVLLAVCFAATTASSKSPQRIVGGKPTTIDEYPNVVALLGVYEWMGYTQVCGGVILNFRSVLTAAHCPVNDNVRLWRIRIGSSYVFNEGTLYGVSGIIVHPYFWQGDRLHDIAILRADQERMLVTHSTYIAGPDYILPDNTKLVAVGWDVSWLSESDQLRYSEVTKVNEKVCDDQYEDPYIVINEFTLCTSNPVTEGPEYYTCEGESGGPVFHNNVVVGISTFENKCDGTNLPRIYTRIAAHTEWIVSNS
ncbi:trypsin, alkaline C-like [Spodoptera litura]|uniref:Trypsin, alkaline C-like n=1 Tax=Spodoptera litura TaxID=69820 RepID=A0A9J7E4H9_SPOLT|nr:trypsin, alkaline C-like [Spodoptera litura]